ncbi:protein HUA2-LIKE 3-like [Ananas comosus]|uniref:Protein HUA2-LIKE 3-like n=1 Tax=Ananas comosus TaxID=4615 RepID=A0A6P5GJB1_ANACO|nr:protein HUA2-LIKE 3-like [Ananas comosus]XP_020108020.1 protein HUA2-LIKE 3-like [Ananas comosus]
MAPARRKGSGRAAAAAAAAAAQQWKVGDLVLAKMKGFPAWPAVVSEPEKWGFTSVKKKLLVYFYGTQQIAFCNYADIEAFTEEKKKSLLVKRQGKGADFVRAVDEIIDIYESLKKQNHNQLISSNNGIKPEAGNSEIPINDSGRESPELSSDAAKDNKLEASCALIGTRDVVHTEGADAIFLEGDCCKVNLAPNVLTEKVSILDELRQNRTSTSTSSRKKRQRDPLLENNTIRNRCSSLRRTRSSTNGEPKKFESTEQLNGCDVASGDLISDEVKVEPMQNNSIRDMQCTSDNYDPSSGSALLPSNGCQTSNSSEVPRISNGSNCKAEVSSDGFLEKDVRLNGKFDLQMQTIVFKKKRKIIRKPVTRAVECDRLNKDSEFQVELNGSLYESLSRSEVHQCINKSDGDEHLPLVKRARVRMGKPSAEEEEASELVVAKNELEVLIPPDKCADHDVSKHDTSTISGNNCFTDGMSLESKEFSSSSPANDRSGSLGSDTFWKLKDNKPKDLTVDVEAALPPSKRLHRALKAMSANAVETINEYPESPRRKELIPNGSMLSPKANSVNHPAEVNVGSPTRSDSTRPLDSPIGKNSTPGLTVQSGDLPTICSSGMTSNDILNGSLESGCNELPTDFKKCDEPLTPIPVGSAVCDKTIPSCSVKYTENNINATLSEAMPNKLCTLLEKRNESEMLIPLKECSNFHIDESGDGAVERIKQNKDYISDAKGGSGSFPPNGNDVAESATIVCSTTSNSSGATKPSSIQSDGDNHTCNMHISPDLFPKELRSRVPLKDMCISPDSTSMKDLIAAAQAKRLLSRSTSFSDNFLDSKLNQEAVVSPSPGQKETHARHVSPSNSVIRASSTSDRVHNPQNSYRSPYDSLTQRNSHKFSVQTEANAARKAFEALLCTLTRTKESIGRATRLAIECAKHGIAGEVMDIILEYVEKESSLHKRVDLFFLVDSITQCSRTQKGGAGDVYPSLVQSVLPRLLSSVAPPGHTAWENRRQCLKVLRLWLERKTLPEYIIRHHIREIESINEASFGSASSRRPMRTERAVHDPLREMEGMLVDEYGSNTSFQLPSLLSTSVLEDEEGALSEEERNFEAVTPERDVQDDDHDISATQTSAEKHRHILEDVDGELEMEDVAPPCEDEGNPPSQVAKGDGSCASIHQPGCQDPQDFPPPLPEDTPPSPPPLPSSPPPSVPPCPAPVSSVPQLQSGYHTPADPAESHLSSGTHNPQNQQSQCNACRPHKPSELNPNVISSEPMQFYNSGFGGHHPAQLPPPPPPPLPPPVVPVGPPGSYGNFSVPHPPVHPGNNFQPLPPPPPAVSNQFSFVQPERQQRIQSWGSSCSYSERYHQHNLHDRGDFYGDRNVNGPMQHEIVERAKYTAPIQPPAPSMPDQFGEPPASLSHYGPPLDPATIPCPRWSHHPRISSYPLPPPPPRPAADTSGASGYWRPR